jgi:hypothetical protein
MNTVFERVFKRLEGSIFELTEEHKKLVYEELEKIPAQQQPLTEDEAFQFIYRLLH